VNDTSWILVVEDDEDIREMIVLLLGIEGYEAVAARDGLDALQRIRERGRPGMVFLDLRMPRMSGSDFAQALRADPALASTPLIVLSGDARATEVAATVGATKCLIKPLDLGELMDAVTRVLATAV